MKPGYFIGLFITVFFLAENLLIHDHLTAKEIIKTGIAAVVAGAFAGFLFEWAIGLFRKFMQSNMGQSEFIKEVTTIHTDPDEEIIFQTGANYFKRWEAVGGKLYLTNKRLIFKSHSINIQKQKLMIPISDIKDIRRFKVYRLSNNGMIIQTKDLRKAKFALEDIEEFFSLLSQTMKDFIKT